MQSARGGGLAGGRSTKNKSKMMQPARPVAKNDINEYYHQNSNDSIFAATDVNKNVKSIVEG